MAEARGLQLTYNRERVALSECATLQDVPPCVGLVDRGSPIMQCPSTGKASMATQDPHPTVCTIPGVPLVLKKSLPLFSVFDGGMRHREGKNLLALQANLLSSPGLKAGVSRRS